MLIDIETLSKILACEIECHIFETHVFPALETARNILEDAKYDWKLVPHKPTKEMLEAGCEQWHRIGTTEDAWQAMYCAAPEFSGESDD